MAPVMKRAPRDDTAAGPADAATGKVVHSLEATHSQRSSNCSSSSRSNNSNLHDVELTLAPSVAAAFGGAGAKRKRSRNDIVNGLGSGTQGPIAAAEAPSTAASIVAAGAGVPAATSAVERALGCKTDIVDDASEAAVEIRRQALTASMIAAVAPVARTSSARDVAHGVWLGLRGAAATEMESAVATSSSARSNLRFTPMSGTAQSKQAVMPEVASANTSTVRPGAPEYSCVYVQEARGKLLARVGGGRRFLSHEEALFLSDVGALRVISQEDGLPLSVQELYALSGSRLQDYLVFCHFVKLGYVVRRFCASDENAASKLLGGTSSTLADADSSATAQSSFRGWYEQFESDIFGNDIVSLLSDRPLRRPGSYTETALSREVVLDDLNSSKRCNIELTYDVFLPSQNSRRSSPAFRVWVCCIDDDFPEAEQLAKLRQQANGVPVRIAIVSQGTVNFLALSLEGEA